MTTISRRDFLLMVTGSTVGATGLSGSRSLAVGHPESQVTYNRIRLSEEFFVQHIAEPSVSQIWSLTIDGLVAQPLQLTWHDFQQLPHLEAMRTLMCIGNPIGGGLIGNAVWGGVEMRHLLNQVGVQPSARQARFYARDGYSTAVDLAWIEQPGVLLADQINGTALPFKYGYPVRLLIPGLYGQKQPKWIERIEFIDYAYQGYWESRGWSDIAENQTIAIIHTPRHRQTVQGEIAMQGVAFAGRREIVAVEVRVDEGEWMPTTLVRAESPLAWIQWYTLWTPPGPGTYIIEARATDHATHSPYAMPRPHGANMPHRIVVIAYA